MSNFLTLHCMISLYNASPLCTMLANAKDQTGAEAACTLCAPSDAARVGLWCPFQIPLMCTQADRQYTHYRLAMPLGDPPASDLGSYQQAGFVACHLCDHFTKCSIQPCSSSGQQATHVQPSPVQVKANCTLPYLLTATMACCLNGAKPSGMLLCIRYLVQLCDYGQH